jgi:AcrR family transcriptional regulator
MGRRKGSSLTREQVVDAAVAIVRAEGAVALGVSRVARELGIKPPSIYNHVGPGDALARAVVLAANIQLLEVLKASVRGVIGARDQLRTLAFALRRWALDNGGLYTLMARVEPDMDDPVYAPMVRDMLDLFARPLGQLGVPPEEVVHAIRSLRAGVHGFVLLESSGQFQLKEDPEVSYGWMIEAMIRGVHGSV